MIRRPAASENITSRVWQALSPATTIPHAARLGVHRSLRYPPQSAKPSTLAKSHFRLPPPLPVKANASPSAAAVQSGTTFGRALVPCTTSRSFLRAPRQFTRRCSSALHLPKSGEAHRRFNFVFAFSALSPRLCVSAVKASASTNSSLAPRPSVSCALPPCTTSHPSSRTPRRILSPEVGHASDCQPAARPPAGRHAVSNATWASS